MNEPPTAPRRVGYWRDDDAPHLPDPSELIDPTWVGDERRLVVAYIGQDVRTPVGEGCSTCRLCGQPNGFTDLTDGTYVWPEGLAHYVADHDVRLPESFVQHVLAAARDGAQG